MAEWTEKDRDDWKAITESRAFRRYLQHLDEEGDQYLIGIGNIDLARPENIGPAQKTQGKSLGLKRAIDIASDLLEEKDDDNG